MKERSSPSVTYGTDEKSDKNDSSSSHFSS